MIDPCPVPPHDWWHLPVGICIALAGLIGIVVPLLRERIGRFERFIWTFSVLVLTLLELRMIAFSEKDNTAERDYASCVQLQHFQSIADTLSNSIRTNQTQFDQTMAGIRQAIGGVQETIANTEPYADVRIDHYAGPIINGNASPEILLFGQQTGTNVFYHNTGNAVAKNSRVWFHLYVGKPDDLLVQNSIRKQFEEDWRANAKVLGFDLVPGRPDSSFTTFFQTLTEKDLEAIRGGQTVYRLVRISYRDSNGEWFFDDCEGLQNPLEDLTVGHQCLYLKQKRHRPMSGRN